MGVGKSLEMRPEYDFSNAVHGKHHKPLHQGFAVEVHKAYGTTVIEYHQIIPETEDGNYTEERDQLFEAMTLDDMVSERHAATGLRDPDGGERQVRINRRKNY